MLASYLKKSSFTARLRSQKGAVSVEYAVIIVCLILVTLASIIKLVDPTQGVTKSVLPEAYNAVSYKIGHFGTIQD